MAAGAPPPVTRDIVSNTIHEIELLFSAVWNAFALIINPLRKPDETKEALDLYFSSIPGLVRDILRNISLVISGEVSGTGEVLLQVVEQELGKVAPAIAEGWHNLIKNYLQLFANNVLANKLETPDNIGDTFATAIDRASVLGVGSRIITMIFELFLPKQMNTFNWLGPQLAELAGYDEIIGMWRRPLLESALGKQAEYYWNSQIKPFYPNEGDAVEWNSRGLLKPGQLATIFKYSGLREEFEEAFEQSAYRPVSAFIMLRLLESGVIDTDTLKNALKFNGYRDQDIAALIKYANWAASSTYRAQYVSAVMNAAERGLMTPDQVDQATEQAEVPESASDFIQLTVATRKLEQLAEIYRKSVSAAYKYNMVSDADYVPHLEAIGIAAADAEAHYAVDSINKQGRALLAEERAAAAAARKLEAAAARAALAEYLSGNIDAAAYTAALVAAGMDATLAGYAAAIATARLQGRQVLVYGQLKDRKAAELLRLQVDAVGWQVKKNLIDGPTAMSQLAVLGIDLEHRQALVSAWLAFGQATVAPV